MPTSTVKIYFKSAFRKTESGKKAATKKEGRYREELLALEKLKVAATVCAFVANSHDIVANWKVLYFDPDFMVIERFGFHVKDVSNDIMDSEFCLSGNRFFKSYMQVFYGRIGIQLGDLNWLVIAPKSDVLPCLREGGGAHEAEKNDKEGVNVFQS